MPDGGSCSPAVWFNAVLICTICCVKWTATYPDTAPTLECPGCGYSNPLPECHA